MKLTIYPYNILESGTVTVTGDADSDKPEARLYDRTINLYWKFTGTQATTIKVDQGATGNLAIDALFIPKHNFNGEDITWEWSTNDADWNAAVTGWTQGDNLQIEKTISSSLTKRYWRTTITSMVNPMATEVFMSYGYEFDVSQNQNPQNSDQPTVVWTPTLGATERSTKHGDARRVREYSILLKDSTDISSFRTAMGYLDEYSKQFYIKDGGGNYWVARFLNQPVEDLWGEDDGAAIVPISLIEML